MFPGVFSLSLCLLSARHTSLGEPGQLSLLPQLRAISPCSCCLLTCSSSNLHHSQYKTPALPPSLCQIVLSTQWINLACHLSRQPASGILSYSSACLAPAASNLSARRPAHLQSALQRCSAPSSDTLCPQRPVLK